MAAVVGNLIKSIGSLTSGIGRVPATAKGLTQNFVLKTAQSWTPLVTSVRHRYHSEKIERGPTLKNYGYSDKLHTKGLMPHVEHNKRLPIPLYRPKDSWASKRALKGQNDYIDILGDGSLHPTQVMYEVPSWLRGFKGNEFQMLLRKRKMFGAEMKKYRPTKYRQMHMRIKHQYTYLNNKTKDYYWHRT